MVLWEKSLNLHDFLYVAETIRNQRVLITGASQNIGKQIALEFAKLGANIVVTARNQKQLEQVSVCIKCLI